MGGAQAIKPTERRRHADRAARVGAQREIAHGSRNRRGGPAGRSAGHVAASARVHRLAVMRVGAEQAVEELIADGDAGAGRTGLKQPRDRGRRLTRRVCMLIEVRIAVGDLASRDGEHVLDGKGEPFERAVARARKRRLERMRHESVDGIVAWEGDHGAFLWDLKSKGQNAI